MRYERVPTGWKKFLYPEEKEVLREVDKVLADLMEQYREVAKGRQRIVNRAGQRAKSWRQGGTRG